MITPKEKAKELVEKFKDYVHGYVGGSMLSNYEYPERILSQAKECALITVEGILDTLKECWDEEGAYKQYEYFDLVKKEIQNYEDDNTNT